MIDNETIAKTIGEGPGQRPDFWGPPEEYTSYRTGKRELDFEYRGPNYANSEKDALRVLAWMNEQSENTDEDYELGCRENKNWFVCQYNAFFEDYKCVHRSDCFRMTNTWYGDTAPAAICAAFEWFVQQKEIEP